MRYYICFMTCNVKAHNNSLKSNGTLLRFCHISRTCCATAWFHYGRHSITHAQLYSITMPLQKKCTNIHAQLTLASSSPSNVKSCNAAELKWKTLYIRLTDSSHELLSFHIKIAHVYLRSTNDTSPNIKWISSIKLLTTIFLRQMNPIHHLHLHPNCSLFNSRIVRSLHIRRSLDGFNHDANNNKHIHSTSFLMAL